MNHPKEEKTLVLIKPDALQRNLLGEIVHRFERKGLKIIGMKMLRLNDEILTQHYEKFKDKALPSAPIIPPEELMLNLPALNHSLWFAVSMAIHN